MAIKLKPDSDKTNCKQNVMSTHSKYIVVTWTHDNSDSNSKKYVDDTFIAKMKK